MPQTVAITLLSKLGCHLCDEARAVIERVRSSLQEKNIVTSLDEIDILRDPKLARLYSEEIPVVLINGRRHAIWRVDEDRLTTALEKSAGKPRLFARKPNERSHT